MATTEQIQTTIDNGKLNVIQLLAKQLTFFQNGLGSVKEITPIKRLITALQYQLNADVNDEDTTTLYICLKRALGGFGGTYTLDPSVSIPGQTTVTVPVIMGYNSDRIRLTSTDGSPAIQISDYQNGIVPGIGGTWVSRYGNNPELALYSNQGVLLYGDEQTPPQKTYQTANDTSSPLLSILYDFPVATDVYLQIAGISPQQGNAYSGGNVAPPLTFTQADLLLDTTDPDNPLYYLPLSISQTKNVAVVTSNGVTVAGWVYDPTHYTPGRIYGFANNNTQTIKVQVI